MGDSLRNWKDNFICQWYAPSLVRGAGTQSSKTCASKLPIFIDLRPPQTSLSASIFQTDLKIRDMVNYCACAKKTYYSVRKPSECEQHRSHHSY